MNDELSVSEISATKSLHACYGWMDEFEKRP
jgi:hypothetical protein